VSSEDLIFMLLMIPAVLLFFELHAWASDFSDILRAGRQELTTPATPWALMKTRQMPVTT